MIMPRSNSFTRPIPASLANLSLQYLVMDTNHLDVVIPPGLGNLAGDPWMSKRSKMPSPLQHFGLAENNPRGKLLPFLWNLSSLMKFQINFNMPHGTIPPNSGHEFPIIQLFDLNDNQFSGPIPSSLNNISTLTILDLSANNFTGPVSYTIERLNSLVRPFLGEDGLEADEGKGLEFVASLANCSQLQGLTLSDNYFSAKLLRAIVNFSTTLQEFYLHNNRFTGSIPEDISNLIGLNLLYLGINPISGVIPKSIGKLTNSGVVILCYTSLSGLIPSSVGNLTNLNKLDESYSNLRGPIPASLGNLKLSLLDLSHNHLNGSIPKEVLEVASLSYFLKLVAYLDPSHQK
ncbi:hypothetical protein ACP70R_037157 [Stipagrostis hirtigluma subsp. patula]